MTKVKSNALWNGLSMAQRETLSEWLFDERTGYREAWERAKKEFNFKGSISSIRRYYERTARERLLAGFTESGKLVRDIDGAPVDMAALRQAGLKVVGQLFLKQVAEAPESVKEWTPLARLLLQSEENENRRALKAEENAIRRGNLELARERFEYAVQAHQEEEPAPEAEPEKTLADEQPVYEYNKKANAVSRKLFGKSAVLLPESAEEEEAIEGPKRAAEAEAEKRSMRQRRESWEQAMAAGDPRAKMCPPPPLPEDDQQPETGGQGQAEA